MEANDDSYSVEEESLTCGSRMSQTLPVSSALWVFTAPQLFSCM